MVETIAPVVHGGTARWRVAVALHALGSTIAAALFGAAVAAAGWVLGAPFGDAGLLAVVILALVYAAAEHPRVDIAVPQLRRQVPDWWRTYFGWPVSSFMYGVGLGVGFFTFLAHGTLVVVAAIAFTTGSPLVGAVVMGAFGLARGLTALSASGVTDADSGAALVDRLVRRPPWRRAAANAAALLATAAAAAWAAAAARGGWTELAAAVLTVAFAWAAVVKLASPRRWRLALVRSGLPSALVRPARIGVPLVEVGVAIAGVLGFHRAGGAAAAVLLGAFSGALLARGRGGEGRVACGCFGAGEVDVRLALVRNVVLGLAAAASMQAPSGGRLAWPDLPAGGDVVPAALAVAGLLAALAISVSAMWALRRRA
jgi:hypothetical protein